MFLHESYFTSEVILLARWQPCSRAVGCRMGRWSSMSVPELRQAKEVAVQSVAVCKRTQTMPGSCKPKWMHRNPGLLTGNAEGQFLFLSLKPISTLCSFKTFIYRFFWEVLESSADMGWTSHSDTKEEQNAQQLLELSRKLKTCMATQLHLP